MNRLALALTFALGLALTAPLLAQDAPRGPSRPGAPATSKLSKRFPEVSVRVSSSFAHDYGTEVRIERIEVAGVAAVGTEVLARVVEARGGWARDGKSRDADVLATLQAFVEDWDGIYARNNAPFNVPGKRTYRIVKLGKERVALATYTVHGHISARGQHYQLVVRAYRVRDGVQLDPRKHKKTLPQPEYWSDAEPRGLRGR